MKPTGILGRHDNWDMIARIQQNIEFVIWKSPHDHASAFRGGRWFTGKSVSDACTNVKCALCGVVRVSMNVSKRKKEIFCKKEGRQKGCSGGLRKEGGGRGGYRQI